MSSEELTDGLTKEVTKGILEFSKENILAFIKKFKERKLAFIKEQKTIETVKEQYRSGEGKFYKKYLKNKELLFLVRMGLTLRKMENDEERLHNLRAKIFSKYKVRGLHIAEFAQTGILNRYVGILLEELTSIEDFQKELEEVLENIEKHTIFVQKINKSPEIVKKAVTITDAHSPSIFIVAGIKPAAEIIQGCVEKLKIILKEYELERVSGAEKEILFFKRKGR